MKNLLVIVFSLFLGSYVFADIDELPQCEEQYFDVTLHISFDLSSDSEARITPKVVVNNDRFLTVKSSVFVESELDNTYYTIFNKTDCSLYSHKTEAQAISDAYKKMEVDDPFLEPSTVEIPYNLLF